jgi:hypothetical protein
MMALVITRPGGLYWDFAFGMVVIVVGFLITRYSSIAEPQDAQSTTSSHCW